MRFFIALAVILILFGCTQIEGMYKSCPAVCDDGIACTLDRCSAETRFECIHTALDGPQPFCSSSPGTCKIQECRDGNCVVNDIPDCCGNLLCESRESPSNCPLDCEASVDLTCSVADPLVPILLELQEELDEEFISCTLMNDGAKSVSLGLEASIPNITTPYATTLELEPGELQRIAFPLQFSKSSLMSQESQRVSLDVSLSSNGQPLAKKSYATTLSSHRDILWEYKGRDLKFSSVAWVTPRDACVAELLANAKELNSGRSLAGYAGYESISPKEQAQKTYDQAESIYNAIKGQGISYLNTPLSFDESAQRIRLPSESLSERSGNCMDATLLFSSAFESLGMNSIIVYLPSHAFVGVETYTGTEEYIFIETTLVGTDSFEAARLTAESMFEKAQAGGELEVVHVSDYLGDFTPFPSSQTCTIVSACSDGSRIGECSNNKPFQCMGAVLIENPSVCGCPPATVARNGQCVDAILKNETFVLRSGYLHYVGGNDQDDGTLVSSHVIINSDIPLEVYIVPTQEDYRNLASRDDYEHYPSCRAFGVLSYDQICTYPNTGGVVIENQEGDDAHVTFTLLATS